MSQLRDREFSVGIVVVTYNSADVIAGCLESIFQAEQSTKLRVMIVDNLSTDTTVESIERWAAGKLCNWPVTGPVQLGQAPKPIALSFDRFCDRSRISIIRMPMNLGYAGAVNAGMQQFFEESSCAAVWILNPDCVVTENAVYAVCTQSYNTRAIYGTRCRFFDRPELIQTDGGYVRPRTGVCVPANAYKLADVTPLPAANEIDYISGASMVITRDFYREIGPMRESYFLYYEEVDLAFRRRDFDLSLIDEADVYHYGGTSIGSKSHGRNATPFSYYFNNRNRIRFVRCFMPKSLLTAVVWTVAKTVQVFLKEGFRSARAVVAGAFELRPPKDVRDRLDINARQIAFASQCSSGD